VQTVVGYPTDRLADLVCGTADAEALLIPGQLRGDGVDFNQGHREAVREECSPLPQHSLS